MNKKVKRFTIAERLAIIHDYETSDLTGAEIAHKYGMKSASTISTWKNRLQNPKKSSTFAARKESKRMMEDAERQELQSQIADLRRRLHESEMQNIALNTLIDVAEEQGLQIRKKSGPSSRETMQAGRLVRRSCLRAVWPNKTGLLPATRPQCELLDARTCYSRDGSFDT